MAAFLGMPIEFDAAPRERTPWATWMLCLLIISASLFAFTELHQIVYRFGLIPAQAMRFGGLTFVTSFFLHAGVLHLVGNIYFLFVFGDNVENFLRPLRYFTLITVAAFIGDLTHIAAGSAVTSSVCRREWWNRRGDHLLCAQFSAREARVSFTLWLVVVSMDPAAGLVCPCAMDVIPSHWLPGNKSPESAQYLPLRISVVQPWA